MSNALWSLAMLITHVPLIGRMLKRWASRALAQALECERVAMHVADLAFAHLDAAELELCATGAPELMGMVYERERAAREAIERLTSVTIRRFRLEALAT